MASHQLSVYPDMSSCTRIFREMSAHGAVLFFVLVVSGAGVSYCFLCRRLAVNVPTSLKMQVDYKLFIEKLAAIEAEGHTDAWKIFFLDVEKVRGVTEFVTPESAVAIINAGNHRRQ